MHKRVGNASLGWLCLLTGAMWLAYKYEFLNMLIAALGNPEVVAFDYAMEIRVLLFILSPGLILVLVGLAMLLRSLFSKPRTPGGPIAAR